MDKNMNDYLKKLIETVPDYQLTEEDKKTIQFEGIEQFIFNKLNSAKYRTSATSDEVKDRIRTAIAYNVRNKLPIQLLLPFGAYKLWKLPTAPYPDWAEVFNIVQLRSYLSPIAKAYKYGVELKYFSVDLFVERINRIPQTNQDKYHREFQKIIKHFQEYLPDNFLLKYERLRDKTSVDKALEAIDSKVTELKKSWDTLPEKEKALKIKRSQVNCKVSAHDPDHDKIIKQSVHAHDAFSSGCWITPENNPWDYHKGVISLGHSYTDSWAIHVKSSASSRVNYWVGIGALLKKDKNYLPTVLSYKQFSKVTDQIKKEKIDFLKFVSPNLKSVPVLTK
jgi:hypothetical protein